MPETKEEPKPYRYNRSFKSATVTQPPPEADKEAMEAYIKRVLGIGDLKVET
jgi:hypothetical protein